MPVLSRRTSSSPSRNHPRPSTYVNERSWPNHESFHVFAPCIALSNYSRVKFVHTTHLVRTFGRAAGPTLGTWRSYLSRSLLEEPLLLETALPAPFDDNHQQPRSSDSLRLEHRANFIPIESGASRSVFIRFFLLLFSSLFSLSLSFLPWLLPLIRLTLAGRFWSPGHEFYEFTDSVNRDLLSEWRLFLRPSRTYVAAPTMGQRAASTPQALRLVGARTTMPPSEHRKGNTCQNGRHTFVPSFVVRSFDSGSLFPLSLAFVFPR